MKLFRTMALVGILSVAGLAPAKAGETLSQTALRSLFPGTFHAVASGIVPLKVTALRDGSLIGRMGARSDTGRWSVSRGRLCIMFQKWLSGRTSCAPVVREAGWLRADRIRFKRI
jgi:hypothetical protein